MHDSICITFSLQIRSFCSLINDTIGRGYMYKFSLCMCVYLSMNGKTCSQHVYTYTQYNS